MTRIKLKDREGLKAFLAFQGLGTPPLYYEELLRAGRVFKITKRTKTHIQIDGGLYNLNIHNFMRYFEVVSDSK